MWALGVCLTHGPGPVCGGGRAGRIWLLGAQLGLGRWQATGPFQIEAKRWQIEQLDAVNAHAGMGELLCSSLKKDGSDRH